MNTQHTITHLSWEEVELLSKQLGEKIKKTDFVPDVLIGIAIGGLVPLALLAREIGVRNVTTITARSYTKQEQKELTITCMPDVDLVKKKVLLVDEIADSGKTQKALAEMLVQQCGVEEIKTATLVMNTLHCVSHPDFSVFETHDWIQFPWEEPLQ